MNPNESPQQPAQSPISPPSQQSAPPPVSTRKVNKKRLIIIGLIALVLIIVLAGVYVLVSWNNSSGSVPPSIYVSPSPSASASATPSDLTPQEQSVEDSINQLNQDQKSIDSGLNDQGDSLNNL